MKKLVLIFSLFMITALSAQSPSQKDVYICMGKTAYAYHKTDDCRGIKNCKDEIKKVTYIYATETLKRKPCGYCYN